MTIFEIEILGLTIAPSYYGLMYALGFIFGYILVKRTKYFSDEQMDSLTTHIIFGVILGGRLGYVFFYNLPYYLENLSEILQIWKGGMSFHGGLLGVIIALLIFARKIKKPFLRIVDEVVWVIPIGLGLGRIGNYLNKELLGLPGYTGPLAVTKNSTTYFPTPLLEMFLEGIVLFIILLLVKKYSSFSGRVGIAFLFFYGVFRYIVEFFRIPDVQIGYIGEMTLGQILSISMILAAIFLFFCFKKANDKSKVQ